MPGLTVTSTQNEAITTARIRGIGTVGDNVGLESSVGVVIDGVYRPRNSVGFGDLGQLERIEVLKGPQGTVFGKNTSAGVINVVTRRPSYTQSAEGEVTVGNYGAMGVSGSYNDSLSDKSAFSIYAAKRKRDGWMDVRTGNGPRQETDDYDQNFHTVRAKLLLEPSENLEILVAGDFTSRDENCCTAVQTTVGATAAILNALAGGRAVAAPGDDPFDRVAYSNRPTTQDIVDKRPVRRGQLGHAVVRWCNADLYHRLAASGRPSMASTMTSARPTSSTAMPTRTSPSPASTPSARSSA